MKRELKWLEVKPGNRCNLKCRIRGVQQLNGQKTLRFKSTHKKKHKGFKLTVLKKAMSTTLSSPNG